jgi:hypothetical protein
MDWHEQDIINFVMNNGLDKYVGETIAGVPVDYSAMIGIAHLGGNAGLKKFLQSDGRYDPADQLGTHLSDYGRKFSGVSPYERTYAAPQMRPGSYDPRSIAPKMRPYMDYGTDTTGWPTPALRPLQPLQPVGLLDDY